MRLDTARGAALPPASPRPRASAAVPAAILVAAVAAAWLAGFPGGSERPTRVWRGYETLLVSPREAGGGGLARVVKALGPGVVSELTAPVTFWDFTGIASVPLARLDERIDSSDPRHDPVMGDLGRYFRSRAVDGASWHVVFVPARRPPLVDYARAAGALGPARGGWRLLEFDPLQVLVGMVGLLGFAALLAWPGRRDGPVRFAVAAAGVFLWVPYLLGGGLARLALSLLLLSSWYRAADVLIVLHGWDEQLLREVRGPLGVFLAQAGAALVVLLPAGGFSSGELLALCGPVAGCVLLIVSMALYWGRVTRSRRRRKFEPVPIVRPAALAAAPGQAGFLFALAALIVSAAVPLARSVPVATPVGVLGVRDFSWESLGLLGRTAISARLADSSDLLTHEAWQETLAFGRPWGMPRPDERVYVRGFLIGPGNGAIVAVPRKVKVFDTAWLTATLRRAPPGSVEALLLAQGRPMAVGQRSGARSLFREAPVALLVMFVMSALFAREKASAPGRRRTLAPLMKSVLVRFNGAARRNQIP
jgi:hypothetical protein